MTQADLILTNAAERHAGAKQNARDGQSLKQAGQDRAVENESAEWRERALYLLRAFVAGQDMGPLFAMEDARAYMASCGLADPHDHHIWGALPRQAVAAGIRIRMTDRTREAHSPRTRAHRISLWEVLP